MGRELDAEVAEKVMGFEVTRLKESSYIAPLGFEKMFIQLGWDFKNSQTTYVPYYSTDIKAAWQIIERVKLDHYAKRFSSDFEEALSRIHEKLTSAEEMAKIICLAALKAVEGKE